MESQAIKVHIIRSMVKYDLANVACQRVHRIGQTHRVVGMYVVFLGVITINIQFSQDTSYPKHCRRSDCSSQQGTEGDQGGIH